MKCCWSKSSGPKRAAPRIWKPWWKNLGRAKSVYHTYVTLLNDYFSRPQEVASLDDATEAQKLETIAYVDKRETSAFLDLLDLCPALTERERTVLTLIFFWGYTSAEVAKHFSTSKQNIKQTKLRALGKMRKIVKNMQL